MSYRKMLVEQENQDVRMIDQCNILDLCRSSYYYEPKEMKTEDLSLLNSLDEFYTEYPCYGYRKAHQLLLNEGHDIGKDRVLKYRQMLGLEAIYPKKRTSIPDKRHKIYPYLLKGLKITKPNQVWAADITYIRMHKGFCYLVAIIDWRSRYVLSHRISNTLDTDSCIAALEEALRKFPKPEIFNTDQGSQFTSEAFTSILLKNEIKISMDSKGRAIDNVIIERFFRTLKYEHVYIQEYFTISEIKTGIAEFIDFYNKQRIHASLLYKTPANIYNLMVGKK